MVSSQHVSRQDNQGSLCTCQGPLAIRHNSDITLRILLATKDKNLRLAVYLVVSQEPGMDIVGTASDSSSALALFKTTNPDVVLMDYEICEATTGVALDAMKGSEDPAHIIVLGLNSREKDEALKAGADNFVRKGSAPHELVKAIQAAD